MKKKFAFWLSPEVKSTIETTYQQDNCASQGEFVERAVQFYAGYIGTQAASHYLPRVIADTLDGKLDMLGSRIGRLLFKLTVEESMLMHIIACDTDIDLPTLERLRGRCVQDAKRTNGEITFADTLKFQKEL